MRVLVRHCLTCLPGYLLPTQLASLAHAGMHATHAHTHTHAHTPSTYGTRHPPMQVGRPMRTDSASLSPSPHLPRTPTMPSPASLLPLAHRHSTRRQRPRNCCLRFLPGPSILKHPGGDVGGGGGSSRVVTRSDTGPLGPASRGPGHTPGGSARTLSGRSRPCWRRPRHWPAEDHRSTFPSPQPVRNVSDVHAWGSGAAGTEDHWGIAPAGGSGARGRRIARWTRGAQVRPSRKGGAQPRTAPAQHNTTRPPPSVTPDSVGPQTAYQPPSAAFTGTVSGPCRAPTPPPNLAGTGGRGGTGGGNRQQVPCRHPSPGSYPIMTGGTVGLCRPGPRHHSSPSPSCGTQPEPHMGVPGACLSPTTRRRFCLRGWYRSTQGGPYARWGFVFA